MFISSHIIIFLLCYIPMVTSMTTFVGLSSLIALIVLSSFSTSSLFFRRIKVRWLPQPPITNQMNVLISRNYANITCQLTELIDWVGIVGILSGRQQNMSIAWPLNIDRYTRQITVWLAEVKAAQRHKMVVLVIFSHV